MLADAHPQYASLLMPRNCEENPKIAQVFITITLKKQQLNVITPATGKGQMLQSS